MENITNQSYYLVLRENQGNVILSSNNYTIQNPQISDQEARYIVQTESQPYIQIESGASTEVLVQEDEILVNAAQVAKDKNEDVFWDRNRVRLLLTLYFEQYKALNPTGQISRKVEWDSIAAVLGSTADECMCKYKHLRRTYIRLWRRKKSGRMFSWMYYDICDEIFNNLKSVAPYIREQGFWDDNKIRTLLNFIIDNFEDYNNLFKFTRKENYQLWEVIATVLGTTPRNCCYKFKSLKQTYIKTLNKREPGKKIKWPYTMYLERIIYKCKNEDRVWDSNKIKDLIAEYAQIAYKFRDPKYTRKELWREIGAAIGETAIDCDRKFRNLRQTYKRLKSQMERGTCKSHWTYFHEMDSIHESLKRNSTTNEGDYIEQLLTYYLENKDKFKYSPIPIKFLWKPIATKLNLTAGQCDKKFRNLKASYLRILEKQCSRDKIRWPYYSYFEKIYDEEVVNSCVKTESSHCEDADYLGVREVLQSLPSTARSGEVFTKLVEVVAESNDIQRERNVILMRMLERL